MLLHILVLLGGVGPAPLYHVYGSKEDEIENVIFLWSGQPLKTLIESLGSKLVGPVYSGV